MKKLFTMLLVGVITLTLSGCGAKSDYEQLVKEASGLNTMQYAMVEVAAATENFDFSYLVELDMPNETAHISVLGFDLYVDTENVYLQLLGSWYYSPLTTDMKTNLEEEFNYMFFTFELPEGDELIGTDVTGIEIIDEALNGKSYNEAIIATDNGYTISGLEDVVLISAEGDVLQITANSSEDNLEVSVSVGKAEKFEVPSEAIDGNEISTEDIETMLEI